MEEVAFAYCTFVWTMDEMAIGWFGQRMKYYAFLWTTD
jgi:hypothetical protein